MGNDIERSDAYMATNEDMSTNDEVGARELGLKNNLKLSEVNTLIDYYKLKDPENGGLLPEQFKEAVGAFIASGLTIDPNVIFAIFNSGNGGVPGRVTLREFILGYAILCRGSAEGRLKYLFAIYGNVEGEGYLTRQQLVNSLKLMQRIVTEVTDNEASMDEDENEKQIMAVADELISSSSETRNEGISYDDFIEKVMDADVVTPWLEELSVVAGDHLKYIERRELDVVELHMERQGILATDSQKALTTLSDADWGRSSGPLEDNAEGPSSSNTKSKIPLPKRYKLVRRDMKSGYEDKSLQGALAQSPESDESGFNQANAAKPFVINYDQIKFGKILGCGACATVYECEWLHVPVAVKVFNDGQGEAAGIDKLTTSVEQVRKNVVGDYVEEFWLLLQIRHPNCLLYMGICFEPVVCIVTELFTGGSVSNFLHGPNPRKFTPLQALEMLSGVARGMFYLHASSPPILHRDLKASNILINRGVTHCVICDFGLSSLNEASGVNNVSQVPDGGIGGVGTPYTMAPEVMKGKQYLPPADVYSFGIVMYEMYTGRFPFLRMKPMQLVYYVLEGGRPKFHDEDDVPPVLKDLIQQCWSQDPASRPSFEEILVLLTSQTLAHEISEREDAVTASGVESEHDSEDIDDVEFRESDLSKRLLEAVYRGFEDKAARLIDQGAKVNYTDYDKRTPLHVAPDALIYPIAAAEGHTKCIRLLLSAGARISYDRWGNSPTADASNYANRTGDSEPARILRALEGRRRGVVHDELSSRVVNSHQIELLRNSTARTAAADGDIVTLKKLLDSGIDVDCADYDRRTPLTIAASEGRRDVVELLIRHGANVAHRDRWACTAYHEAERGGYHDIIRLLRQAEDSEQFENSVRSKRVAPNVLVHNAKQFDRPCD